MSAIVVRRLFACPSPSLPVARAAPIQGVLASVLDVSPAALLSGAAGSFPPESRFVLYGLARPDLPLPSSPLPCDLTVRKALASPSLVTPAALAGLAFLDAATFTPGSLSSRLSTWQEVLQGQPEGPTVLRWLTEGVSFSDFAAPFSGSFSGAAFSSPCPPPQASRNHPAATSPEFLPFVRSEVAKSLLNGGVRRLGRVGEVAPPHVVCPLGVEPNKPRLIVDARFPNLWQRPPPFAFDRLLDLARTSSPGDLLSVWDHKSGYFHIRLAPDTQGMFGFELDGIYYVYTVLPFGWSVSPYVYQTVSRCVSVFLRRLGIADFTYLDDTAAPSPPGLALAHSYVKGVVLTALGYFVELRKSHIIPAPTQQWLGFVVDLADRTFRVPEPKLVKFLALLDMLLAAPASASVPALRSFAGKCVALAPAVPGALLYTRCIFSLLARADAAGLSSVALDAPSVDELLCWRELRAWHGTRRWRDERHIRVLAAAAADASDTRWGGWFQLPPSCPTGPPSPPVLVGDVWPPAERALDICTREMLAGVRLLECLPPSVRDCTIILTGDNLPMVSLINSERAAAGVSFLAAQRALFRFMMARNIAIDARWVPSAANVVADAISRLPLAGEGSLNRALFLRLQAAWGSPFSLDAFAGPLNAQCARFLSWFRTPVRSPFFRTAALAVDFFAFPGLAAEPGLFVYPPPALLAPAVAHLRDCRARGALVAPWAPGSPWWPVLQRGVVGTPLLLAPQGVVAAVSFPDGSQRPLRAPLYGFFFSFE